MTTITTVIDPPLPTDTPAVFNTKAFEAWQDINDWATEANALALEVNTSATTATTKAAEALASANTAVAQLDLVAAQVTLATTQAELAAASANFVGLWLSLTGALNKPATVSHNGKNWALANNLSDVTLSEPGVAADWVQINQGGSNAKSFYFANF